MTSYGIGAKTAASLHGKSRKYNRFNWIFLALSVSPVLALGLFNLAIDPYGILITPAVPKVNLNKPEKITHERLFKAVEITYKKPDVILLGSSRTQWGLDPRHPALAQKGNVYNAGLSGASSYEVMRYFQHALTNQPNLKTVVLGIDFFMFSEKQLPQNDFDETRLDQKGLTQQDFFNILFSLHAWESSRKTLLSNSNSSYPNHQIINGMFLPDTSKPLPGTTKEFVKWIAPGFKAYTHYKISQERLQNLRSIVEICKQKNIELKVFISPSHATEAEAIHMVNSWPEFEQWKREVVSITPIWDFSGYNSITTEKIQQEMKNYLDNSHYRKEIGDLILHRLFHADEQNTASNNFGILMTPDNVESHLAQIRADQQVWRNHNHETIQLLQNLKDGKGTNTVEANQK